MGDGKIDGLPFATSDGKTKAAAGGSNSATGGHNFTAEPQSSAQNKAGGRNFSTENRPQSPMKAQPGLPNTASIPEGMGGKILQADPKAASEKVGGPSGGTQGTPHKPFKSLK
jgi:hypothetical protein